MEEFIFSNLSDGWEDCKPLKLSLEDLQNELYEIIATENYLINVFPINGKTGFVVNIDEFKRDLNEELDKIQ